MDGMTELQTGWPLSGEEISTRVANFKSTMKNFQRERE